MLAYAILPNENTKPLHAYAYRHVAVTLSMYTDPVSLLSFAEECSFGNWSSIHTIRRKNENK